MQLTLPYPPSNNRYYRHHHGRVLLSREGRAYRLEVLALRPREGWPMKGSVRLTLEVYPPTRWGQDLDNIPKAICDALQHSKVIENDQQVDELRVLRRLKDGNPRVVVSVEPMEVSLQRTALGWEPK